MVEKREKLPSGAARVEVCQPHSDEAAVPTPLVGIEVRGRPGPPSHVVLAKDFFCSHRQRFTPHEYASWEVRYLHCLISFWSADPFLGCTRLPSRGSSPLRRAGVWDAAGVENRCVSEICAAPLGALPSLSLPHLRIGSTPGSTSTSHPSVRWTGHLSAISR